MEEARIFVVSGILHGFFVKDFGSIEHVNIIYDIRSKLRLLGNIEVIFNSRATNSFADMLAKKGSSMNGDFVIKVAIMLVPVIILFCTTTIISAFVFHDHYHRKVFVGTIGLVAAVTMYGSPLVAVRQVIRTKSVEFMPFYLSLFSFLSSLLWMIYGLLSHEWFIASANMASTPLGLLQLIIYFIYRKKGIMEEPNKWDIEQNEEKSKQLQLVTGNNILMTRVD